METDLIRAATREILDMKSAADYLGVSRSHLSHILAGKVPRVFRSFRTFAPVAVR